MMIYLYPNWAAGYWQLTAASQPIPKEYVSGPIAPTGASSNSPIRWIVVCA